jgi:hypothetical protein
VAAYSGGVCQGDGVGVRVTGRESCRVHVITTYAGTRIVSFFFFFLLSLIYPGGGDAPLAGDQGRQGQDGYRVPENMDARHEDCTGAPYLLSYFVLSF